MRRTSRLVLLLGIFLAAVVFIVILASGNGLFGNGQPTVTAAPTSSDTVLAVVDIPLGTVITTDMVEKQVLSNTARDKGALGDPSQAIGQKTYQPISAGAQVTLDAVSPPTGRTPLVVPTGLRGFAIQVNELTGVGNIVNVGDYVDVIISEQITVVQKNPDGSTTTVAGLDKALTVKLPLLLEDVQIIGTIDQPAPAANGAQGAPAASSAPTLSGLTKELILAVTPGQAEALLFARSSGVIDVILRAPGDTATVATDGVILKSLIDKYGVLPPSVVIANIP